MSTLIDKPSLMVYVFGCASRKPPCCPPTGIMEGSVPGAGRDACGVKRERLERLVLFDIDGTILYGGRIPARSILRAIEEVFGVRHVMSSMEGYSFAGKTDPEIVIDILLRMGYDAGDIEERLGDVFERYVFYLRSLLTDGDDAYLYPGVLRLLRMLKAEERVILGLLTGNIEEGARIKLGRFGLEGYFRIGAYGSDSVDRNRLPGILLERAREMTDRSYRGEDVVIIGDSVYDIRCAGGIGAKTIAVATGSTSQEDLAAERPDHLFKDLTRTRLVFDTITS